MINLSCFYRARQLFSCTCTCTSRKPCTGMTEGQGCGLYSEIRRSITASEPLQEEFLRYLRLNQIEYDERYILEVKFARTAPRHKSSFNVTPGCARKLADPGLRSVPPPGAVFGQLQHLAMCTQMSNPQCPLRGRMLVNYNALPCSQKCPIPRGTCYAGTN